MWDVEDVQLEKKGALDVLSLTVSAVSPTRSKARHQYSTLQPPDLANYRAFALTLVLDL